MLPKTFNSRVVHDAAVRIKLISHRLLVVVNSLCEAGLTISPIGLPKNMAACLKKTFNGWRVFFVNINIMLSHSCVGLMPGWVGRRGVWGEQKASVLRPEAFASSFLLLSLL